MSERLPLKMPGSAEPQDCALWRAPDGETPAKLAAALRAAGYNTSVSMDQALADVPQLPPLEKILDALEADLPPDSPERVHPTSSK